PGEDQRLHLEVAGGQQIGGPLQAKAAVAEEGDCREPDVPAPAARPTSRPPCGMAFPLHDPTASTKRQPTAATGASREPQPESQPTANQHGFYVGINPRLLGALQSSLCIAASVVHVGYALGIQKLDRNLLQSLVAITVPVLDDAEFVGKVLEPSESALAPDGVQQSIAMSLIDY